MNTTAAANAAETANVPATGVSLADSKGAGECRSTGKTAIYALLMCRLKLN